MEGNAVDPDLPSPYLKGIGRSTSGAIGDVWPRGCGRRAPVVAVPPRDSAAGDNPYPWRHRRRLRRSTARRVMV